MDACHSKNDKDKAEDVSANDINGVKVRFIPETTYKRGGGSAKKGRRATRALTDVDIEWIDVASLGVNVSASDNVLARTTMTFR